MNKRALLLVVVVALLAAVAYICPAGFGAFTAETNQETLPTLLDGCRNAVAAIQSGQGKVTVHQRFKTDDGGDLESEASYQVVFSGDKFAFSAEDKIIKNLPGAPVPSDVRITEPGAVSTRRVAYDGQRVVTFMPQENEAIIGDRSTDRGRNSDLDYRLFASFRGQGLVEPDNYPRAVMESRDIFTRAALQIVGREIVNGDECMVVEAVYNGVFPPNGDKATYTYWFWVDPTKGFTVPRIRHWIEGGIYKEKTLIAETTGQMRQYPGGVWGPASVAYRQYKLNRVSGEYYNDIQHEIAFAPDFQLNLPVEEAEFDLVLPSGTQVTNELLSETYTVP